MFLFSSTANADTVQVATNINAMHAIVSASPVVQLTLLILVAGSVISWAIMVQKRKQFSKVEEGNMPFEEKFWKASSLEDVFEHLSDYPESNLANVFRLGYLELRKIAESGLATASSKGEAPSLSGIDNLQRSLRKAIDLEISRLEARLS